MNVTEGTTYRMLLSNIQKINTKLEDLQNQGATGLKLNKPSDDPASIRPVLTTRTQITTTSRSIEIMGVTQDKMQSTDGQLNNVEDILQKVKELTTNSINGSLSSADMNVLADQVSNLRQQLVDTANGMVDGKYIFAGYQETVKPFVPNPNYNPNPPTDPLNPNPPYDSADSSTWPYIYQGDANPTELEIAPGERLQTNLTGNDLFMGISNSTMQAGPVPPATGYTSDPGRIDIFSVLTRTEEALRAGNIDDPAGAGGGLQQQMTNLDTAADQSRRLRSQLGNKASWVDTALSDQQDMQVNLTQILSRYQDSDSIATYAEITKQQTALQAALSITANVSKISILDYLK